MNSVTKVICLILCVCAGIKSMAQRKEEFFISPKLTPASPEVSALFRFSEAPVDYSSGTLTQSIPLYTITAGRISCPVSVSYSTGGVKVQDIASMVGLGWNLSWGGIIYEAGESVFNAQGSFIDENSLKTEDDIRANLTQNISWIRLSNIANGVAERQKPEYHFRFGEYSGTFFYDVNNGLHIKSGNHNLLIEKIADPGNNYYKDGFKITTDQGIQYTFLDIETSTTMGSRPRRTAYLISRIEDLNGTDYINFTYENKAQFVDFSSEVYNDFRIVDRISYSGLCSWAEPYTQPAAENRTTINSKRIAAISSSNETILFNAAADRLDIDPTRITDMVISNKLGEVIRKVKFNQSYFVSNANLPRDGFRLRLDGISFYNADITKGENYKFEYNQLLLPPYRLNGKNSTGVDYWGYYNGKDVNAGLIPKVFAEANGFTGRPYQGDRNADPFFAQASILRKIQYPTGGYAEFSFEGNAVTGSPLGIYASGLRVKRSTYYASPSSKALTKEYQYMDAIIPLPAIGNNFVYAKRKDAGCGSSYATGDGNGSAAYNTLTISSSPNGLYSYFNLGVFYKTVEERTTSGIDNIGKIVYKYNNPEYSTAYSNIPEFGGLIAYERKWANDKLLRLVQTYKKATGNNFVLLKEEENLYADYRDISPIIGLQAIKKSGFDYVGNPGYFEEAPLTTTQRAYMYHFMNALNSSGIRVLKQQKVREYSGGDTLETISDYEYEPVKYQIRNVKTKNSMGEESKVVLKYPYEASSLSAITSQETVVMNSLVLKNMIASPVEQETYVGSALVDRKRTVYGPDLRQKTFKKQTGTGPLLDVTHFIQYDASGNLLEYRNDAAPTNAVIWDTPGHYPLAEVSNAGLSEIAYTSFERNDLIYSGAVLGQWTTNFNGYANSTAGDIPMGKYCLATTAGTVMTKGGLTNTKAYTCSYWSKSGTYTVSGTTGTVIQGKTLNGWTNYIHTLTGITSVSVSGTAGFIDELRLYPANARMSTYDHIPSVGLHKICDFNNNISTYEYDDLGNLKTVRDQNNAVKKSVSKSYSKGNGLNTIYWNFEQTKDFIKNNCANGAFGSTVPYVIPENTYSSLISQEDADSKARTALETNGQANANTSGFCTFYNKYLGVSFNRTGCGTGTLGSAVIYEVQANTYSSLISQADADNKAMVDANTNGQAFANQKGQCVADAPTISVKYTNQASVFWNVKAKNLATSVVYTGVTGSNVNGTLYSSLPIGIYEFTFSSNGQSVGDDLLIFTVNGQVNFAQAGSNVEVFFNNITVNAIASDPLIVIEKKARVQQACSFSAIAGWSLTTGNLSKVGQQVNFYLVLSNSSSVTWTNANAVASIQGGCRPSGTRVLNMSENNRSWEVVVYSSGQITIRLLEGTPPASGQPIYLTHGGSFAI